MKINFTVLALLICAAVFSQEISGDELLEKSIQFHDPNGNWNTFIGEFFVTMETPNTSSRKSRIRINLPEQYFYVKAIKDTVVTEFAVHKNDCNFAINGNTNPTKALQEQYNVSCKRAHLYKNYYTYLYGLPMKLKDKGTLIHPKVTKKKFKGKVYLVLKVSYEEKVGKDTWYFYFNPKTYALEVYQFYKKEKDSGEYILLTDLEFINGIKMPKNRVWYLNKNNVYLGTDVLSLKM